MGFTSRVARTLRLLALVGLCAGPSAMAQVDIIDLHINNSSGVPIAPYGVGTSVTVAGVITSGHGTFTPTYIDVYIQDATAGIMIYDVAIPYEFEYGDSVTVTGTIAQYRGMTEIDYVSHTLHASNATVPAPMVLHCDDVEHVFQPDYTEPDEGRLVRLNNVSWTGTWPTGSGGITLHDGTGTCTLYIDQTTGIQSMTPPTGPFDVVGVIKQYAGYAPPYTSGYEILPRSEGDFYLLPGPQIVDGPRETNIQADNVTIHVETDTETTAIVRYGLTSSHEIGQVTDGLSGTVHDIVLPGLASATIHHYEVTVEDLVGQSTTPDLLFCSGAPVGSTGEILVYFNKSVDQSFATHTLANGNTDLEALVIEKIEAAEATIDIALYSFDLPDVTDALIAAKDRGVLIRFVYEHRATYQGEVTRLINNGIWVIDDAFGPNNGEGLMHHKLWIFDAANADPTKPWVMTGSWNLSVQGTVTDIQNAMLIQDQALATVCTEEFNEMWGSTIFLPNPDQSRFGANKLDNTPKLFNIAGREASMYFAPSDGWLGALIQHVREADYSIDFCVLSYTRYDLCDEMEDRWMNVPGMAVRGIFDSGESGNQYSQYWPMSGIGDYAWNPVADVWLDAEYGTLHHKYMILDANRPASDPVIVTGSANWSTSAYDSNDENVFILHDDDIANQYFQEYADRYHAAGGTGIGSQGVDPAVAERIALRVGPNPAQFRLSVSFAMAAPGQVTCDLCSPDGRLVERIADRHMNAGAQTVNWEADQSHRLSSGVYYLRLHTPEGEWDRKVTLVR